MQLCGDESKGSTVVFVMTKNGHAAVKVGHSLSVAAKTQRGGDFSGTAGKQGKVQLGHGSVELAGGEPNISATTGLPSRKPVSLQNPQCCHGRCTRRFKDRRFSLIHMDFLATLMSDGVGRAQVV